jgi:3'(2'), 5'-bisphosphate nucleotidase
LGTLDAYESAYWFALLAAKEASEEIVEIYGGQFQTEIKSDGSPVTEADLASSKIIDFHLAKTGFPVVSEENEHTSFEERKHWDTNWCVDPLDGTREFVKRNGEFAVNIALIRKGKPIFGVIAHPMEQRLLFGGAEFGVFESAFEHLDVKENWVNVEPQPAKNGVVTVTCSRAYHNGPVLQYLNDLKSQFNQIEFIKKGSSLKFFDLAHGRAHTYPRFAPTMEWDIASGQAILEALGGKVLHATSGEPLVYNKENLFNPYFLAHTSAFLEKWLGEK